MITEMENKKTTIKKGEEKSKQLSAETLGILQRQFAICLKFMADSNRKKGENKK